MAHTHTTTQSSTIKLVTWAHAQRATKWHIAVLSQTQVKAIVCGARLKKKLNAAVVAVHVAND